MKNVFAFVLIAAGLLLARAGYGQNQPPVDSQEYQEWKLHRSRDTVGQAEPYTGPYLKLNSDKDKFAGSNRQHTLGNSRLIPGADENSCYVEKPMEAEFGEALKGSLGYGFTKLPANDDGSSPAILLPFSFNFHGDLYRSVYVNNNGNISFGRTYSQYTPEGFPNSYNMIAPFWADVDTRSGESGKVYYKVEDHRFTVIWYQVGYYNYNTDRLNTFKLVISDGTDPSINIGNNVAFMYGDMNWTTGDASDGVNGFGGYPATVGINKGDGNNNCFFYQLGRFNKPGTSYYGTLGLSGVDYLDYKCFYYDVSQIHPVGLDFKVNQFRCGLYVNPQVTNLSGCDIDSIEWDFGDGASSSEQSPIHAYADYGTYTVGLTVNYTCGACGSSSSYITKTVTLSQAEILYSDSLINVQTHEQAKVLDASAVGYSGNWTPDFAGFDPENGGGSFYANAIGKWKPEKVFHYDGERQQSTEVDVAGDGSYTLDAFNWQQSRWAEIPQWIPTNTITGYTSSGYEKENRDILGIYSAAIYDYGGELVTARAINSRHDEMAYTGFEVLEESLSGNWQFGPRNKGGWNNLTVALGNKFFAVVEAPLHKVQGIDTVTVMAKLESQEGFIQYSREKVPVLCREAHENNPHWSVLVLGNAPSEDIWTGKLFYKKPSDVSSSTAQLDTTYSHSGRSSLKVSGRQVFEQSALALDTGKVYQLSGWMSVGQQTGMTPVLGEDLGLEIHYMDKRGQFLDSLFLFPSGPVIEGWQQVRGRVSCPGKTAGIVLKFTSGNQPVLWVDDLRLFPENSNMQSYVYDWKDYRLSAVLDEENYATFYYYDEEGKLYLVKKETIDGVKTITEAVQYQVEREGL